MRSNSYLPVVPVFIFNRRKSCDLFKNCPESLCIGIPHFIHEFVDRFPVCLKTFLNCFHFHPLYVSDLTFESRPFEKIDSGTYLVTGQLSFHGITREVVMEVNATKANRQYDGKEIVGFKAKGKISRSDFGISSDTPDAVLSDEVHVHANVIFVKE